MVTPYLGEIRLFAGPFAPNGWAFCAGQTLPISSNGALFSLIGTTYGGNGSTNFQLPDYRGRVIMGQGQGAGLTARAVGDWFGVTEERITENTTPPHSHPVQASGQPVSSSNYPTGQHLAKGTIPLYNNDPQAKTAYPADAVQYYGGDQPHVNMMPYMPINYIIAMAGVFPSRS